jgi:aminopeptidase N
MFRKIAGFEFRYQVGHPLFWITSILFFLLAFATVVIPQLHVGDVGNVHRNAPYALAITHLVITIFYMFVTAAFVAGVVVRDEETGFGPILKSTGVSKFDYLIGRFTGAYLVAALGFLTVPLGMFVGSLMPWVDPETLGPNRLQDYAFAYGVLALPTIFLTAAIFFGVATATRSMMGTYLGVIGFLVLWGASSTLVAVKPEWRDQLAITEPFGLGAFGAATRYWAAEERNTLVPALQGALLWNRLLWIGIAVLLVATAYGLFRFEARGAKPKKAQKLTALANKGADAPPPIGPLPKPRFDAVTARAQLWKRTRFEMAQVFKSPVYLIVLALGLLNTVPVLWFSGVFYGTSVHPVTRIMIQVLLGSFLFVPPIIAAFYAGELVWRERDRKVHEIVDASAIPDWAYVLPKTLAIAFVLASTLLISAVAAVGVQIAQGYDNFEIGKYLLWYVLPGAFDWTLLAIFAVFLQSIVPHKFIGWGLMIIYLIGNIVMGTIGWEDYLYHYGRYPDFPTPLSDMNGLGKFWITATWFRIYWGSLALILTVLSYGLWRRGTETRLWPRLKRLPFRLKGPAGALAGLALLTFAASGAFIFYNTHVLNEYRTSQDNDKRTADAEKALLPYEKATEPTVTSVKLNFDLYPHEPRLVTKGVFQMENRSNAPISEMHLTKDPNLQWVNLTVTGAHLARDDKYLDFRIYRFDQPLQPGAKATLEFTSLLEQKGFKNRGNSTRLVDNGTFVNNSEFGPIIGINRQGWLQDRSKRRKYGLPPELRLPKLEDDSARRKNYIVNVPWVMSDITITTDADQTPIAPGYKISDVTQGGRRTVEFKTDAPILEFFSVQSARYLEKHVTYKGIDIGVYYDPQHPYNVDRMIKAAEAGLDYFQANFGPYQFRQFRFIEFPDYQTFAQSFANTVPWSEGLGFIADLRKPEDIDYVTYVGAHELGHQWWAHQEISAEMQGETMLVETLAQYSALMVMEKMYGPDHIRKFLKYELDNYLRSRGSEAVEEEPLERVENQPYIHYRKGAVVMYLLKDQIGEEAVNRALRSFLADWKFKGPPYPASKDLVAKFRAEAPADKQQLITDLFEKITIWDLKAKTMTVKKRADGKFDVRLTVEASKVYANGKGKETKADIGDETFDIGLFTDKPSDKAFGSKSVLLFQKLPLKSGTQTLEFVTDKAPKFGGVDPYNKFIDRNSEDNVVQAGT